MFKFDFDVEEDLAEEKQAGIPGVSDDIRDDRPFKEHTLEELIQTLPDDISYSSVRVGTLALPRRDLFDVRLQLMASEAQNDNPNNKTKEDHAAIEFASRPSDLVPQVYEGGMKTWECSLDLAGYLHDENVRGKRVLEVRNRFPPTVRIFIGNLAAWMWHSYTIPGDLAKAFEPRSSKHGGQHDSIPSAGLQFLGTGIRESFVAHKQTQILTRMVRLRYQILFFYVFSKAGEAYRATVPPPSPKPDPKSKLPDVSNLTLESVPEEDEEETETSDQPQVSYGTHAFNITEPGDLAFTPTLLSAFLNSLASHRIEFRFFSGPWDGFTPTTPYDLVLTSETIYQPTSLPSLVRLLRDATGPSGRCLVAAKMVYFGVGGGIREFEQALEKGRGSARCVWEQREGVGRSIMQVVYDH
ncbi:unnamed protein product [Rhizoctonia solani]|uniref:Histidine protein methyltransferase 1 n=1 Tax=Rhizoctonia solani TaxID=456999 RepID=A0A8H3BXN9_9AGAM|nr:unnamed protein product [Rhizoctonia solani]